MYTTLYRISICTINRCIEDVVRNRDLSKIVNKIYRMTVNSLAIEIVATISMLLSALSIREAMIETRSYSITIEEIDIVPDKTMEYLVNEINTGKAAKNSIYDYYGNANEDTALKFIEVVESVGREHE